MSDIEKKWLSIHIYLKINFDFALNCCIFSLTKELYSTSDVNKCFFIKYTDNDGPHIRFRVKFNNARAFELGRQIIFTNINAFINKWRIESSSLSGSYISEVPYEQEIDRYGGPYGIEIAESVFNASSLTILSIMHASKNLDYHSRIIVAMKMNLSMISSFIEDEDDIVEFFEFNYQRWLSYAVNARHNTDIELSADLRDNFSNKYKLQSSTIISELSALYKTINGLSSTDPNILFWVNKIIESKNMLKSLAEMGQIAYPEKMVSMHKRIWPIFDSYVHMNNNRLGIKNSDESFISFIIITALKEIDSNGGF
jgi:thiopeptide-type bacteriocin biosynthesis protein